MPKNKSNQVQEFLKKSQALLIVLLLLISAMIVIIPTPIGAGPAPLAGPTYVGGEINTTQTWTTTNSPYIIQTSLKIGTNGVLYIQPGVQVKFDANAYIVVYGNIYSNGTANDPIIFTQNLTPLWDGIYIKSSGNSFIHTNISLCDYCLKLDGNMNNIVQNNVIEWCNFTNADKGIYLNYADNNRIDNTTIKDLSEPSTCAYLVSSNNNEFYNFDFHVCYDQVVYMQNSSNNKFYFGIIQYGQIGPGLYLTQGSEYNYFYDINISYSGFYQTAFLNSGNNTMNTCSFSGTLVDCVKVENSRNVQIQNSELVCDVGYKAIALYTNAEVIVINSIFDNSSVNMFDTISTLLYQYYLEVEVQDTWDLSPVSNANVIIKNVTGSLEGSYFTQANGVTQKIPLDYHLDRDKNGNTIIDPNESIMYTPHNVTVTHDHFYSGYLSPEPVMDQNRLGTVKLNAIPIDYIIISNQSSGAGEWVDDRKYFKGNTTTFYAAGYNNSFGYIGDLPSTWQSSDEAVATVSPQGPSTMFEAIENGTMRITVNHKSIINQTGIITVEMWNLQPSFAAIPDQILDEDRYIDNAVDLWSLAEDHETDDINLTFLIISDTEPNSGVSIENNRYVDIYPTQDWFGTSDITIEVWDGYTGYNNTTFSVIVKPVNDAPMLTNGGVDHIYDGLTTIFNFSVTYTDIENDPPSYVYVSIDGLNHTMESLNQSDLIYDDGKEYFFVTTLAPGPKHSFKFITFDSKNITMTQAFPELVFPELYITSADIIFSDFQETKIIPNGTLLTIQTTVHNNGELDANAINVSFELQIRTRAYETWTKIGEDVIVDTIAANSYENITFRWTATPMGNYTLRITIDPKNAIPEINEEDNSAEKNIDIGPAEGILQYYEITPKDPTMFEGESIQFQVIGYDFYSNEVPVDVAWAVTGGGTIDDTGNFTGDLWGTWMVYANYSGMAVNVNIEIMPMPVELSKIEIIPSKWIMVINDTKIFEVRAYDSEGIAVKINPEWILETGGGAIDRLGLFRAEEKGRWILTAIYPATNGEYKSSAIVRVLGSKDDKIVEDFSDPSSDIDVTANVGGSGTIDVMKLDQIQQEIPKDLNDIGIYVDITKSETLDLEWALIKIPFNSLNLPDDVKPETIKIYYWDGTTWTVVEDSWVEGNAVYANVTHFTVFAPMSESSEKGASEEEDNSMIVYAMVVIIIIAVIILISWGMIRKKRATEKEAGAPEAEELEEEETEPGIIDELEMEFINCRDCEMEIEVPISEDEKMVVSCSSCGAKGRIKNPYLKQIEKQKKEDEFILLDDEE